MQRKVALIATATAALGVLAGAFFVPISSSASVSRTVQSEQRGALGLTTRGVNNAIENGMPARLVAMTPQSSLTLLSQATEIGPHASNSKIKLTIGLHLRHVVQLKQFLQELQNPASAVYHQWLTPVDFTARYGPSEADVEQVVRFLKAQGINVRNVSSNRILIHTEATTTVYEHAFGIRINDYKLNGRRFYSTTDSPRIPRSLGPLVSSILGLNHGLQMRPHSYFGPLIGALGRSPNDVPQPPAPSLTHMNPLQIANAYNWPDITNASDAQGITVAILTAVSSGLASLSTPHDFWAAYGLPDHTVNVIPIDGDQGSTDGMGETLLDVEYSGALGPGSTLNVYVAGNASFQDFTDMFNQFVTDNTADVMTTSWGAPETSRSHSEMETDNQIFMQAAAQGISMFAAAGDHGSGDGTNADNVADFPSSSPYILAANGTQLTIASLAGAYGHEVVWNDSNCFNNGRWSTGGAVSQVFDKPTWQQGPGVPSSETMRMNSGIALTASCSRPMLILQQDGWYATAGTSAVAPQLSGLFAIADAENANRLGQANSLIYGDANTHYATDFHDVTSGNNGAFSATVDWDHPSGWGSVNAGNLLSHIALTGPKGTLSGKVTAASAPGSALVGAKVTITINGNQFLAETDSNGKYLRVLPAGTATVTASLLNYEPETVSAVITDGTTTTQNFALQAAPQATLLGQVTDGSGHGYALYADIVISSAGYGVLKTVWTNPETGEYTVSLPAGTGYELKVASALRGYVTATKTLTPHAGNNTENFALTVAGACTAPGYHLSALGEDFDGGTFPPAGWGVTNADDGNVIWKLASQLPQDKDNWTGGTGDAASADSNALNGLGTSHPPYDTSLVTPPISVTSLHGATVLKYKANYQTPGGDALDLDISTDGGNTWQNISHWTSSHGTLKDTPGVNIQSNLAGYLPTQGTFQLRWRYYDATGGWNWYAQIDDVSLGTCTPVPGGLVMGQVTDPLANEALVDAKVTDDLGGSVRTIVNQRDPNLQAGFYQFFVPEGARSLTAVRGSYTPDTVQKDIENNQIKDVNFALSSGKLTVAPASLSVTVQAGSSATASFAISNIGDGLTGFLVSPSSALSPSLSSASSAIPKFGAAVSPAQYLKSQLSTASVLWLRTHGKSIPLTWRQPTGLGQAADPWVDLARLPTSLQGVAAATDPSTGTVYAAGGSYSGFLQTAIYAYDPATDRWSSVGNMLQPHSQGAAAFLDGKFYVVNGFQGGAGFGAELEIYDPATGEVSTGNPNPLPAEGGSGSAVVNGKWYVVGGCGTDSCESATANVEVYNPASGDWSSAPDYPHGVDYPSCGGINGKLYCAGGAGVTPVEYTDGYVYDPSDPGAGWTPIANMPLQNGGLWGSAYTVSAGRLLISGGGTHNFSAITNAGFAYYPKTDTWGRLPSANYFIVRGGSACGFYQIGGLGPREVAATVEVLPSPCSGGNVPWLTVAPPQGTLASGASSRVELTFSAAMQTAPGTTHAYLWVTGGRGSAKLVSLTVNWQAGQPPVAQNGSLTTDENTAASGTLEATDPDGDPLTFSIVAQAGHGTVTLDDASTGAYTYTPDQGYSGADSFTFKASDGTLDSNVATVSVTVTGQPPVASNGSLTTNENTAASGTLDATDPDGDPLTFSIVAQPGHGTVTLDDASTGAYTYTPDQDYSGADSFTFKANDGTLDSNVATVSVTVKAADKPPVASNGSLTADENTAASGMLEATDPDGDPLTFSIVAQAGHGTVTLDDASTGAYTYTPDQGYSGADSFTFKASDGTLDSNVATISVTVTGQPPVASNGSLTTDENTAASGMLEATDPDGDPLTFSIVAQAGHGTVTLDDASTGGYTYTPDQDYSGADSFTFKASDGTLDSNVATVSVTVKAADKPPVASNGSLITNDNTAASGMLDATDPDDDPLTFSIVAQPGHGTVTLNGASTGAYTYTPDQGYSGADSFTFKASDGTLDSNVATVSVTVKKAVVQPPVASNGSLTTNENTAGSGTLEATDPNGNPLTFSIVAQPGHGTVTLDDASTGAYTYTPDQDYSGADSFTFKVSDGTLDSNVATVSVTVKRAADQPPVASNGSLTTEENTAASGTLDATDPDGDPLTFRIVAQPGHGTVTLNDASTGGYTYTPDQDYSGADSFTFKVSDGALDSNVAVVGVTVQPAPPPPPPPPPKNSGGGGFGWATLAALLGLMVASAIVKVARKN